MNFLRIDKCDVRGKRLLVRADLNVPLSDGVVTDSTRINRFAEGMRPLLDRGARLVILTHLGRPGPELNPAFSVDKLRPALSAALGRNVIFSDTSVGPAAEIHSGKLQDGEVLLCENVRYNRGEEQNDHDLAAGFARLGDIYVNDAFSCSHRAHASIEAITNFLPAAAGPLLVEETEALGRALEAPERPAVAIVGGSKVSTKISVLKNLVTKLDAVIVGGGMANTFLFAKGAPMGTSLHEPDQLEAVAEIEALAEKSGCEILLPEDVVCASEFKAGVETITTPSDACPDGAMILDAGPSATKQFSARLAQAKTVLWNGPLGAFEVPPFDTATTKLAQTAGELAKTGSVVAVAGGGDTVAALNSAGVTRDFTYVSSAGGAFLEWIEGKPLPGIAALSRLSNAA